MSTISNFALSFTAALWATLCQMAPYLLFGFLVAGLLSVLISPQMVERHLGKRGIWPVIKAAILGIPLPLCSCGVIPVAASLRMHGASRGATTSFLLSTPQTGVDSIAVTFSLLGPVFAIFRPIAAFVSGVVGGIVVEILGEKNGDGRLQSQAECCSGEKKRSPLVRIIEYALVTLPRDIGRALLLGILLAGLISILIPDGYFAGNVGHGIGGMLVMMALGIPMYVCATASVPIAAALIAKGVSPGAALVFLMTGPATNAAAIATIWKIMGRHTALIYLGTLAVTSLACGIVLDFLLPDFKAIQHIHVHEMLPQSVQVFCAISLLSILGTTLCPFAPLRHEGKSLLPRQISKDVQSTSELPQDQTVTIKISGMKCSHCVQTVERGIRECQGVNEVHVDLSRAIVNGSNLDIGMLKSKIETLGYVVENIAPSIENRL